ncbi:PREDICTED: 39S ribosomal protein L14, mitochondrial-like isoform X2 [Acropora digitifera]|uniref:39S ribosomal protein L14, mitochondrial-like isoform X2 n=1 Tax=Acropora digitifera TaxID=70779 RepID=UPI000779FF96|nr:PREDICTED: 39S ribosomal protein L14, mitochondrial-like isoform X2 [Acropora digitifera]
MITKMASSCWRIARSTFGSNAAFRGLSNWKCPSGFHRARQIWNAHSSGIKLWSEVSLFSRYFPSFNQNRSITLLTTFKVIDNSALAQRVKKNRQPYLIGFYRKRKTADPGDLIRVAIAGKTNKALVIGTRKTKHHTVPRYDNNCIVLVDDNLAPLGTRIKGPVPTIIRRRQAKYSKVLALASRFI